MANMRRPNSQTGRQTNFSTPSGASGGSARGNWNLNRNANMRQNTKWDDDRKVDWNIVQEDPKETIEANFRSTAIGKMIAEIRAKAETAGETVHVVIERVPQIEGFYCSIGRLELLYVPGLGNPGSAVYRLANTAANPAALEFTGHPMGTFIMPAFANHLYFPGGPKSDVTRIVIYDDDLTCANRGALMSFIIKAAFPNPQFLNSVYGIRTWNSDVWLHPQNGARCIFSKDSEADRKALIDFRNICVPYGIQVAGTEFVGIARSSQQNQGGFGSDAFAGSGNSWSNFGNGSFAGMDHWSMGQVSGWEQQQKPEMLPMIAGVRYYVIEDKDDTGKKVEIICITEIFENPRVVIKDYLDAIVARLASVYQSIVEIRFEVDISMLSNYQAGYIRAYTQNPDGKFHNLYAYVEKPQTFGQPIRRIHSDMVSLQFFKKRYKHIVDNAFPKALSSPEDRAKFEKYLEAAGMSLVATTGDIRAIMNLYAIKMRSSEVYMLIQAIMNKVDLNEYRRNLQERQQQYQPNPGYGWQDPSMSNMNFGMGGMNGNLGNLGNMGGGGFGFGMGQASNYGNNMGANPGFGGMPGGGYGAPYPFGNGNQGGSFYR